MALGLLVVVALSRAARASAVSSALASGRPGVLPAGEDAAVHLLVGQLEEHDAVDVVALEEELACRALRGKPSITKP